MVTYIVRQPIMDTRGKVTAYELLYKEDESTLYNQTDSSVANAIEQFLLDENSNKILNGKQAFITFTPNLLLKEIPKIFSVENMVIQIDGSAIVHPHAREAVYKYKKSGYSIALKGFEISPRYLGILDTVDIVKLDMANTDEDYKSAVGILTGLKKTLIAYNVEDDEAAEKAKALGCQLMQGKNIAKQYVSKIHNIDHLKSNFFQLMVAVTKDEVDLEEITQIISRDVTLAFSLLKLVNSAYFALKNRVKSVKQALVILGIGQLKQWIYLLSFKNNAQNTAEELIKVSFLRGTFCEKLLREVEAPTISPHEAYLMGMFSTLDVLMEVSLEEALRELPISEDIKDALILGEGDCAALFNLMLSYEKADWNSISRYADELKIPHNVIARIYFEAIEEVRAVWDKLTVPYEEQI